MITQEFLFTGLLYISQFLRAILYSAVKPSNFYNHFLFVQKIFAVIQKKKRQFDFSGYSS